MGKLIERFPSLVKGSDRIVFKSIICALSNGQGAMNFCRTNSILEFLHISDLSKRPGSF
jgi:hypothetical protein